ncbi:MAG: Xaa-Pro peptidase family protein [Thermoplasmataceae archaeon]
MVATSEFAERLKKLQKMVDGNILLTSSKNIFYFSGFIAEGFERLIALVVDESGPVLIVPALHKDEASELESGIDVVSWDDSQNPVEILLSYLRGSRYTHVEGDLKAGLYVGIPGTKKFLDQEVESLRSVKSEGEIASMKKAAEIAEKSFEQTIQNLKEGITEQHVASILEQAFRENGSQSPAFQAIVSFGANGADPHHLPNNTRLKRGEGAVIDFGCVYDHYCSDTTRTVFFGKPSPEFERIYNIVLEAQETGCSSLKPGKTGAQIDGIVREIITRAGYGERFIHRTGHGIGLDVHESPYVDQKNKIGFQPGNCVTIEPGIYITGKFGIRIEDFLLVKNNGSRNFNDLSKELTTI